MIGNRVLLIEDDRSLPDILKYNLAKSGFEVILSRDGGDGLRQAQLKLPDIVILDLMLPVMNGLEVCRRIRSDSTIKDSAIIMLTAKAEETDQVVGFSMGADDYVTKPFSIKVLMERLKALQKRRTGEIADAEKVSCHGITIDRRRHRVYAGKDAVSLTLTEFRLLEALVRQPGRAFTRNDLIQSALGDDTIVLPRTIDVHIRAIRKKLGTHSNSIETVRGIGYRMREE